MLKYDPIPLLLESQASWISYLTSRFLLNQPQSPSDSISTCQATAATPLFEKLISECRSWPEPVLKRHNDARLLLHKFVFLAEMGLDRSLPEIAELAQLILAHQHETGAFLSNILIPKVFGGTSVPGLDWMLCDAPLLLFSLIQFGYAKHPQVEQAIQHLISLAAPTGWPCASSIPKMRGPGKKDDPCPYANLVSLKALVLVQERFQPSVVEPGIQFLLKHWEQRQARKIRMFGIGTDFQKLKYPNIWYGILHVVDVLSHFPQAIQQKAFQEMWEIICQKQNPDGGFIPESVWLAWKEWDFGQKKVVSPTLTLKIALIDQRIQKNVGAVK